MCPSIPAPGLPTTKLETVRLTVTSDPGAKIVPFEGEPIAKLGEAAVPKSVITISSIFKRLLAVPSSVALLILIRTSALISN